MQCGKMAEGHALRGQMGLENSFSNYDTTLRVTQYIWTNGWVLGDFAVKTKLKTKAFD